MAEINRKLTRLTLSVAILIGVSVSLLPPQRATLGLQASATAAATANPASALRIAVPAYFDPGDGSWDQLLASAPMVGLAVINPDDGPGAAKQTDYVDTVSTAQSKHITILGYVHTSNDPNRRDDLRTLSVVEKEIDQYFLWYKVDGIFLDEVSTDCSAEPYYQKLYEYIKGKSPQSQVVINPGTTTDECYMAAADIIMNFESSYEDYRQWSPMGWEQNYPASRFWHIIHTAPQADLTDIVARAKQNNVGWLFVTPLSDPDTVYGSLPNADYWKTELSLVQQ